jgi:type IV pilus assembly protein PilO
MAIDLDQIKNLSPKVKALLSVLICIVVGYLYYSLFLQSALTQKFALEAKMADLQKEVAEKEKTVAQLDRYIREVEALKESFKVALMKLPNEREIAGILSAVVLAGREAGVDFLLFEPGKPPAPPPVTPGAPKPADTPKPADAKGQPGKQAAPEKFYDEIPIKVQLAGPFHKTVSFFDKVARLPRIVNIEEITLGDGKDVPGRGRVIKTACIIKTYMFVDKKPAEKK